MYDEEYDDYEEYVPRQDRRRPRRRFFLQRKFVVAAFVVAALVVLRFRGGNQRRPSDMSSHTEVITVSERTALNMTIQRGMEHARAKAEAVARAETRAWIRELQVRIDEDFLPLWFGYIHQQSVSFRAAGYWCMDTPLFEGVFGAQETAEERLRRLVEREFNARVLVPGAAQQQIAQLTRRAVEVYVNELRSELKRIELEYVIRDQDFARHLGGVSETVLGLDANRSVPLPLKAVSIGGAAATLRLGGSLVGHVQDLCARRFGPKLLGNGAGVGGRIAVRGVGWWVAGACALWDLVDHHQTRSANLPVMRKSLATLVHGLEEQVLTDPRCGVLTTLDRVEQELIRRIETQP
jgi:hypothetical protein